MEVFGKNKKQLGYVAKELLKVREIVGDLKQYELSEEEIAKHDGCGRNWFYHPTLKIVRNRVILNAIVSLGNTYAKRGTIGGFLNKEYKSLDPTSWVGFPSLVYSGNISDFSQVKNSILRGSVYIGSHAIISNSFIKDGSIEISSSIRDSFLVRVTVYKNCHIQGSVIFNSHISGTNIHGSKVSNSSLEKNTRASEANIKNVVIKNSRVFSAFVKGRALDKSKTFVVCNVKLTNGSIVRNMNDYASIGPLGTEGRFLSLSKDSKGNLILNTGCFTGNYKIFKELSSETHKNLPKIANEYDQLIRIFAERMGAKLD